MTRGYVDTSIGQIHYREVGSGPAVLFIHQAGRTGATYDRVAQVLAPRYRVVSIDLPGFGESDPLPLPCSVTDLVDTVFEALDGLGVETVRLSGHHTGAVVVGELAASHPDRTVAFAPSGYPFYQSAEERKQVAKDAQVPRPITQMGGHSVPIAPELHSDGSHLLRVFQRAVAMLWYSKVSLGASGSVMLPFENLPPEDLAFVNDFVVDNLKAVNIGAGALSMGHARALLGLPGEAEQLRLSREIVARNLSVRETESMVKKAAAPAAPREEPKADVHTRAAEEKLRFALGTRVRIVRKGKSGRIEIDFQSEDELHRIYEQLTER
mgnify:CR=1 FL=1